MIETQICLGGYLGIENTKLYLQDVGGNSFYKLGFVFQLRLNSHCMF